MKEKIIFYSKTIQIDDIGFANINCNDNKLYLKERIDLSNYTSVISIIVSHPHVSLQSISKNQVYFSSVSWGKDYHLVLKEKMQLLVNYIKLFYPKLKYKILVDNHPLDDKYLAYLSGLGFYGRNNLLINDKFGSYIFIGNILTNLPIEEDKPLTKQCYNCKLCVAACPTKALTNKYNYTKCLAYLTQSKTLTKEQINEFNNCIYGCDICSDVCPYNKINYTHQEAFKPIGIEFIDVDKYKSMTNKEFNEKYGILSGSWRGKNIIERNINIYKERRKK
ncbi:MAG: tRNA epoxyqueuosine(34) reductase QueG [bacterium]|nr:tRNA epoxyqueuosine(34) reductase QueG [bacterium]